MIAGADSDFLRGIARLKDKLIILLDLSKVLATIDTQIAIDTLRRHS